MQTNPDPRPSLAGELARAYLQRDDVLFEATIAALEAENAALREWKTAITDAAVVSWTLTAENENDPRKAVNDLLNWTSKVALDPRVSKEAAELHETIAALRAEVARRTG